MRFFFLLIFGFMIASAQDALVLNAHVRMLPKIMALDTRLSKSPPSKVIFAVVYDSNRKANAQLIADEINKFHNGKVSNISFSAIAQSADEIVERKDIAFVYTIGRCSPKSLKKVAEWGITNSVPTFSYDVADLEYGLLGSIAIERSSIIYINKNTLKEGKFHFDSTLYQIARLVD
jgi:hypothetical protein